MRHAIIAGLMIISAVTAVSSGHAVAANQAAESDSSKSNSPITGSNEQVLDDSAWYDAESGKLIPVYVPPSNQDPINRNSRWLPQAQRVAQNPNTAQGTTGQTTGLFGTNLSVMNVLGWLLLIVIALTIIGLIFFAVSKTESDLTIAKKRKSTDLLQTSDEQILERMKHLPAELRRTDVNLRSEAQRLMGEGQFDQAIILLFGHQLLLLDRVGMLRLNRGKTNRRYVRETRRADTTSGKVLRMTVHAFERSYFGRHAITAPQFEQIWKANESLEKSVERRREVAA